MRRNLTKNGRSRGDLRLRRLMNVRIQSRLLKNAPRQAEEQGDALARLVMREGAHQETQRLNAAAR